MNAGAAEIAAGLGGRRNGAGWSARCPAHDDGDPSLSIGENADGKPLLHCHAGCEQGAVIAALRDRGLWGVNGHAAPRRQDAKRYPYCDADGKLIVTVVRRDLADGKRIHREPKGAKAPPNGYPLFRFSSLIANPELPVLIVEGEKTAEVSAYLFAGNYEVTTAIGGAGKAGQTDWTPARGREVVIWPDADGPGRDHARDVARLCREAGATDVRIVDTSGLPDGWDLADPINGFDIEQLVSDSVPVLYRREPSQKPNHGGNALTLAQLYDTSDDDIEWCVDGLLPRGGTSIFSARPKAGKTVTTRVLGMAKATGRPCLGREVAQGSVLVCAFEEIKAAVAQHYRAMGATPDLPLHFHIGPPPPDPLLWLEAEVERIKPALVIVDPLFPLIAVEDGNNYAEVGRALAPVIALARSSGAHIMAVHHNRKSGGDVAGDEVLGSTSLFAGVDTLLTLRRSSEGDRTISSTQRYGMDMEPTLLTLDPATMWITPAGTRTEQAARETAQEVYDFLADEGEAHRTNEIVNGVDHRRTQVLAALKLLQGEGRIVRSGSGKRNDPHCFTVV